MEKEFKNYAELKNLDEHLNIELDYKVMKDNIKDQNTDIGNGIPGLFHLRSPSTFIQSENKGAHIMKKNTKRYSNIENQKIKILEQLMKKNFSLVYKTKINKI